MNTHPSHVFEGRSYKCALCGLWKLTAEAAAPCRGAVVEKPAIDWIEINRGFSA